MKKIILFLCVMGLLAGSLPLFAAADALEDQLLGSVSAKYESNGDPGTVSGGSGDLGGASYGAYQFASAYDVPLTFARWCVSSGLGVEVGNALQEAFAKDDYTFGSSFNAAWKAAAKDREGFLKLQRLYVKSKYYDPAVAALKKQFNLDVSLYGIAFKNAVWSRTLQHGLGSYENANGFMGIMKQVEKNLPNSLSGSTEKELITAIYEESGRVVNTGTNPMKAVGDDGKENTNAWIIRQYGLEGKYMKYYSGNSAAVQAGVYLRLRVNEPAELLKMLETYGGYQGSGNHGKTAPHRKLTHLVLTDCDVLRGWNRQEGSALSLSTQLKKQGEAAVELKAAGDTAAASIQFSLQVSLNAFDTLGMMIYLPEGLAGDSTLSVLYMENDKTLFTSQWPLAGLEAGWQTVELALPSSADLTGIDCLQLSVSGLTGGAAGQPVYFDYIRADTTKSNTVFRTARVDADALNCRTKPSTAGQSLGLFGDGQTLTVMGKEVNGWYFCTGTATDGKTILGWCSGDYLMFSSLGVATGDVNGDKKVDTTDALFILRYTVEKATMTDVSVAMGDLNGDGKTNAADALIVLQITVGKVW